MINESKILEQIKEARKNKGFNQQELAKELGLNKIAYNRIENGKTKLTIDRLIRINEILDINSFSENSLLESDQSGNESLIKENDQLKKRIIELEELVEVFRAYRHAYIQELTIGETMIIVTERKVREAIQKGEKYELTSHKIRKAALEYLEQQYPDLNFGDYYFVPTSELKDKLGGS